MMSAACNARTGDGSVSMVTKTTTGDVTSDQENLPDAEEFFSHIHPALLTIDASRTTVRLSIMVLSFLMFVCITIAVICLLKIVPFIRNLPWKSRRGLAYHIVINIYSITLMVASAYHCFWNTAVQRDPVEGLTKSAILISSVVAGYFVFTLAFSFASEHESMSKTYARPLTYHHIGQLVFMLAHVYVNKAYGILAPLAFVEVTAPLQLFRDFLKLTGMNDGRAWKVTLHCIVHAYHIRSMVQCYVWFLVFRNWQSFFQRMPVFLSLSILGHLTFLTFYFTPYVGYKYTQMLYGSERATDNSRIKNTSDSCQSQQQTGIHCE